MCLVTCFVSCHLGPTYNLNKLIVIVQCQWWVVSGAPITITIINMYTDLEGLKGITMFIGLEGLLQS